MGVIRTTQILYRDEPAKEKYFYLSILATDNGEPQLHDMCTFKVTIEDVNDNSPVFHNVVCRYYPSYQFDNSFTTHIYKRIWVHVVTNMHGYICMLLTQI